MCSLFHQEMNIWNIFLTLVILHKKVSTYMISSGKLLCFSQPKGDVTKECDKTRGFKTCFTRYDGKGLVTGRGCSTKRSSYKKCETHSYGKISQKFCYCKKSMCNLSTMVLPCSLLTLSTSVLLSSGLIPNTSPSPVLTVPVLAILSLLSTALGILGRITATAGQLFFWTARSARKRRKEKCES